MKHVKTYESFVHEMEIPSGKWVEYDLSKLGEDEMKLIWDM